MSKKVQNLWPKTAIFGRMVKNLQIELLKIPIVYSDTLKVAIFIENDTLLN